MTIYQRKNKFWYTRFSISGHQVHRKLNTKDSNEALKIEAMLKNDLITKYNMA